MTGGREGGKGKLLPPHNSKKNALPRERGSSKSLSDQGSGWGEKATEGSSATLQSLGWRECFPQSGLCILKMLLHLFFIKPRRTDTQQSLAVPGPWGTGPWHDFVKGFKTENEGELLSSFPVWDFPGCVLETPNSKAYSEQWPWIFTGLSGGWFRKSSKLPYCAEKFSGIWHITSSFCCWLCCRAWHSFTRRFSSSQ